MNEVPSQKYKSPFIARGVNKGRIRDTDVAHEVVNTLEDKRNRMIRRARSKKDREELSKKYDFFKIWSEEELPVIQAAKNVGLERDYRVLEEDLRAKEENLERTQQERDIDKMTGLIRPERYEDIIDGVVKEFRLFNVNQDIGRQNLAIAKLDIDLFSWWNDLSGTALGDLAMQVIGSQIRTSIRPEDIAIRKGGEEIIIIPGKRNYISDYELEVERLVREIRTFALKDVIHILRDGQRKTIIHRKGEELEERSSTIILKSFASELIKKTEPGGLDYFMRQAKGGPKKDRVKELFESVKEMRVSWNHNPQYFLDVLKKYILDDNTYSELGKSDLLELAKRRAIESELCDFIQKLYKELTMSAGLIIYTDEDRTVPPVIDEINGITDSLNIKAKSYAPSSLAIQIGREAKVIKVNEVSAQIELNRRTTGLKV